eukprot:COSAG05_NODE_485_length_9349_cov_60.192865_8_plen_87_part_00
MVLVEVYRAVCHQGRTQMGRSLGLRSTILNTQAPTQTFPSEFSLGVMHAQSEANNTVGSLAAMRTLRRWLRLRLRLADSRMMGLWR